MMPDNALPDRDRQPERNASKAAAARGAITTRVTSDGILLGQIVLPPEWLERTPPPSLQHQWLTGPETAHMLRFRQTADQWRMVAGRVLLRSCLREHFGVAFAEFTFGAHNKPMLAPQAQASPIDFNLTHDRQHLLAAFSTERDVGIDVAAVADFAAWEEFCEGYLDPREIAWVSTAPQRDQPWRALRMWTLKEAILKSTGHGLDIDPREIVLMPDGAPPFAVLPASLPAADAFTLREWRCGGATGAALASVTRAAHPIPHPDTETIPCTATA